MTPRHRAHPSPEATSADGFPEASAAAAATGEGGMRTASGAAAADQVAEASPDPTGTAAQRAAAQAATGAPAGVEPMPGGGIATDDPGPDPDAEFPGPTGPQRSDIGRPASAPEDPEREQPEPEPESGDLGLRGNDELTTGDATRGASHD